MIVGHLANIQKEIALYPAALREGFKFLSENDIAELSPGRHAVWGDNLYAVVSEYDTQPKRERRPEAHRNYLDIQYIAAGEEMIGSAPLEAAGEIAEDCLKERDVVYYKSVGRETETTFSAGMFAVYFPWDVHRPNCSVGENAANVRKVVVKLAMKELGIG